MRGDGDVVCLAPAGYLASFGQTAHVAYVESAEVDPVVLEGFAKLPLRRILFSHRDWRCHMLAQASDRRWIFATNRVFDEVRAKLFEQPTKVDGVGRVESRVYVDNDLSFGAKFVADRFDQCDAFADGSRRLKLVAL